MPTVDHRIFLTSIFLLTGAFSTRAQVLPAPAPPPPPESPAPTTAEKPPEHPHRQLGFLIRGTIFDARGLSVPGAELRIRRAGEKKFHWDTYSNSRGEFAIRVPPGTRYEVVVQSKAFSDATQTVDAGNGLDEQMLVFHMEPVAGRKK
jgi:hypothetical protein